MGRYRGGKPTCEGRQSIDLAYLRRRGLLEVGRYTTLTWSRWGEETGSIMLIAQQDGVRLRYQTKDREGAPVDVNELVPFAYPPARFGAAAGSGCVA